MLVTISSLRNTVDVAISACRKLLIIEYNFSDRPNILTALIFSRVYDVSRSLSSIRSIQRRWYLLVAPDTLKVAATKTARKHQLLEPYSLVNSQGGTNQARSRQEQGTQHQPASRGGKWQSLFRVETPTTHESLWTQTRYVLHLYP